MKNIVKMQNCISLLIVSFISIFYLLTSLYPLHGDDWTYRFIFNQKVLVQNLSDVFASQKEHWFTWGGRFVAHFLAQSFLLLDKIFFNITNTACYAACCALIAKFSFNKNFLRNWLLVLLSFWIIMPSPGGTMFWLTGSFNYLWPSFFTIAFLVLLFTEDSKLNFFTFPIGIIAGNGHEAISLGISIALILYSILAPRKPKRFYIAVGCYIIGSFSNFLAPGNYVRLDSSSTASSLDTINLIQKYVKHLLKVGYRLTLNLSDVGVQFCTCMLLLTLYYFHKNKKTADKGKKLILFSFILGTIFSISLNVLTGTTYSRAMYGFCFLSYLSFTFAIGNLQKKNAKFLCFMLISALVMNLAFLPIAYKHIQIFNTNVQKTIQCSYNGNHIACAHSDSNRLKASRFAGFGPSPCILDNWSFADLYGCEISLLNAPDFSIIYSNKSFISSQNENQSFQLNYGLHMVKLSSKPKYITEQLTYKPLSSKASFFAKLKHIILKQKKNDKLSFLIKLDDTYYLCWHSNKYNGTLNITYNNEETYLIYIN